MKKSPGPLQSHFVLVLLIAAASCLRIFICLQHNPMDSLFSDPLRHWLNGIRFPWGGYLGASDPILYQVYIGALRRLTFDNRFLVALASGLMSVAMPWTYYRAARNFGLQKTAALWIWLLIACTPSLFVIYHYIMMETLLLAIDGAALWATARYLRKGGQEAFLLSVAAWTLACLTKPTVVPLAGVCVLWSCWKRRPSLGNVAEAAIIALLLLVPQGIRSKIELGFIAPLGNPYLTKIQHRSGVKWLHLYFTSHHRPVDTWWSSPTCYIRPLSPLSSWQLRRAREATSFTIRINADHGTQDWENAYSAINASWKDWLQQWRENIVVFLFAPSWPENYSDNWDGRLESLDRWIWAPLIFLTLVFNLRDVLRRRFELIPIATTILTLFLMLQNVATTEGRYRKPVEPLLLMNLVWIINDAQRGKVSQETANQALPVEVSP